MMLIPNSFRGIADNRSASVPPGSRTTAETMLVSSR